MKTNKWEEELVLEVPQNGKHNLKCLELLCVLLEVVEMEEEKEALLIMMEVIMHLHNMMIELLALIVVENSMM